MENVESFFLKTTNLIEPKMYMNVIGWFITKLACLMWTVRNPIWLPPQDLVFNIGLHVQMYKSIFIETTLNKIEPNLYMNSG